MSWHRKRLQWVVAVCVFGLVVPQAWAQTFDEAGNDLSHGAPPPASDSHTSRVAPPPAPAGCLDNDLQTTAVASTSGGGSGSFAPSVGNDGVLGPPASCDFNWISAGDFANGDYYELEWPEPVDLCQIFVDTKPQPTECGANPNRILSDATVQWWDGAAWVTETTISGQTDDWSYAFETCVTTTRLRLFDVFTDAAQGFQASNPVLYELKVYGSETACLPAPAMPQPMLALLGVLLLASGAIYLRRSA